MIKIQGNKVSFFTKTQGNKTGNHIKIQTDTWKNPIFRALLSF
jgi:hypothetical protein